MAGLVFSSRHCFQVLAVAPLHVILLRLEPYFTPDLARLLEALRDRQAEKDRWERCGDAWT